MTKCCLLVLTCLWIIPNSLSSSTETISSIAHLVQTIIDSNWTQLEDRSDLKLNKTNEQKQTKIFQKIQNVNQVLRKIEEPISSISYTLFFYVALLASKTTTDESLFCFLFYMQQIEIEYNRLQKYSTQEKTVDSTTMIDFANTAVSRQVSSTLMLIEKIHQHVVPISRYGSSGGVLKLLTDNEAAFDEIVRITGESPNQLLYNLFNKIALTQIKGYVLVQLSYAILEIHGKGHYPVESQLANAKIRTILQEVSYETIRTTANLSRHYWRSDPEEYIRGENYLEISGLLQGYVINEKLLNKNARCWERCETFKESNSIKCQKDPICKQLTRCNGELYSCRSLSTMDMQICLAPTYSTRRYDYIEYKNHNTLGVKSNCSKPIININAPSMGGCHYCMCFCNDNDFNSERYFSLRQAISDTTKNKVVTGIRFAKKDLMIYLQVQQGEILPYGIINATSLEWVPIDEMDIRARYIYNKQDYFRMTQKDKFMDLHVIQIDNRDQDQHRVLTGVRLSLVQSGNPKDKHIHLNFEIRMTKFHFETGKLYRDAHKWERNLKTEFSPDHPRTRIPTDNLDIPTRAKSKNTILSKGNQFVEFAHTDMFKDAGQTTIPFIDIQDVVTKVPTPLVGAGLYYKSTEGYGGFIGLRIVTYDFTQHL
ncbi:hypothetical protein MML48_8g00016302 [Holotrichia oblita]|uniref:Uncharacterized protein n=1 Tax=Holotrichia oblita TaxID=644536 RepID=A0ACB9SQ26_HOLOL|nr:hypothetical protein MML48_8g00016302 [Holotrichia oblita]